ncbi:Zn2 DNA-binding protein [Venustampulla echinocandica]|uniref:Zn2 DNA-binding protein n=1 Tax=Venustampulla echinocandica TaxID=2656787 RepID=A0A370TGE7_9HELO|nr:Zn2 DNA-binding protein [Venustampulla echinocandica]RDL33961.1 Zn2 DNA-binding protein [Venustampulla echinocandica]
MPSPLSSSSIIEEVQASRNSSEEVQNPPELWTLTRAPRPTIIASAGDLSLRDLRLMHHWSTFTWNTLTVGDEANRILLVTVPQLAFESEYLLYCILGISSHHLEHVDPTSRDNRASTAIYRVKALKAFREVLARGDNPTLNWEAALMMSSLLLALCSMGTQKGEGDFTIISWLTLFRGLKATMMIRGPEALMMTSVSPVFRRILTELHIGPIIPKILLSLLQGVPELDPDFQYLESYYQALNVLGSLYASLAQDGLAPALVMRVIAWPTYLTEDFVNCAKEKRPRALIILAYFLVFFNLAEGLWWMDRMGDTDIKAIAETVGTEWLLYLSVPLEATTTRNAEEVARLLLRELT